ncbi:hypothetical protein PINS_up024298 [Pythium insidiosum]|nr:hypothetical protein PINS_up024298 [Pythium insidiosum]
MAGVCSFYSPAVRQFVKRHLRCSYDNVVKHRRWHTLVTSSFLCVRSSEAVLLGFAMVELIASFRSFFDQLAVGNRAHATAAEEDKAMPRQLPFWGFLSLFASSAVGLQRFGADRRQDPLASLALDRSRRERVS